MKQLWTVDICAGAGGWSIAARGLPIRIVAAFDFAWDCCLTHRYNNPEAGVVCADVTKIDWRRFKGIDLVLGAIPCEEISVARNSKPMASLDEWHALLDSVLEGIEIINPRWWAIENVIQMRKHLPPLTPQMVLDSRHWSGQARKRLFIGKFPVPAKNGAHRVLADYLLPGPYLLQERTLRCEKVSNRQWYTKHTKRLLKTDALSPTLIDLGSRHSRGFVLREARPYSRAHKRVLDTAEPSPTLVSSMRCENRHFLVKNVMNPEEAAPTVTESARTNWRANQQNRTIPVKNVMPTDQPAPPVMTHIYKEPRHFTVDAAPRERTLQFTEAAALQGFPSDYVFVASQSRAWKMVAQAVQIDTARAILEAICAREAQ